MFTQVYKTLAKIVGIVLVLAGIGATAGGIFSHSFVSSQLTDQAITMPSQQALQAQVDNGVIQQADYDALIKFAGQPMTTGPQAQAFADHYIAAHMKGSAARMGIPAEQQNYNAISHLADEALEATQEEIAADNPNASEEELEAIVQAEINDPLTNYDSAKKTAALHSLRDDTFLNGNTNRGMLLNAYGWWLIGTIGLAAGIGLIVIGGALTVGGFVLKRTRSPRN